MSDREHAKEILEAARRDLRALHGMNDPQVFSDEIFGFHAQQAAEKGAEGVARSQWHPFSEDTRSETIDRVAEALQG
jgi:hypothetical protein